jgi:hypothetical protein
MFEANGVRNTLRPMLCRDDIDLSLRLQGRVIYQTTRYVESFRSDNYLALYRWRDNVLHVNVSRTPTHKKVCSGDDVACMEILFWLMDDVELWAIFIDSDCYDALMLKQAFRRPWVWVSLLACGLITRPTQAL